MGALSDTWTEPSWSLLDRVATLAPQTKWPPLEDLAVNRVHHLRDQEHFESELELAEDRLMVIDISMRYCGPCKVVYPFVAELSNQLPDVRFYHLCGDQDESKRALMRSWRISATPNFHFYRNGKRIFSFMGSKPDQLVGHLSRLTGQEANAKARQTYLDTLALRGEAQSSSGGNSAPHDAILDAQAACGPSRPVVAQMAGGPSEANDAPHDAILDAQAACGPSAVAQTGGGPSKTNAPHDAILDAQMGCGPSAA